MILRSKYFRNKKDWYFCLLGKSERVTWYQKWVKGHNQLRGCWKQHGWLTVSLRCCSCSGCWTQGTKLSAPSWSPLPWSRWCGWPQEGPSKRLSAQRFHRYHLKPLGSVLLDGRCPCQPLSVGTGCVCASLLHDWGHFKLPTLWFTPQRCSPHL